MRPPFGDLSHFYLTHPADVCRTGREDWVSLSGWSRVWGLGILEFVGQRLVSREVLCLDRDCPLLRHPVSARPGKMEMVSRSRGGRGVRMRQGLEGLVRFERLTSGWTSRNGSIFHEVATLRGRLTQRRQVRLLAKSFCRVQRVWGSSSTFIPVLAHVRFSRLSGVQSGLHEPSPIGQPDLQS
jgi:hypothetical protein